MKEIIVSVILPNYNHSVYLKKRIDSILGQTYEHFELILLDDCSSDNSREVLSLYKDNSHVSHVVFNEENSGSPFKQWDKGVRLAQGKYIWIAESDDYAHPDFLAKTVAVLDDNSDVVVVYSGSQMIDTNEKELALDWDKFKTDTPLQTKYDSRFFLSRKMLWNTSIYNASMAVFRKDCYDKVDKGFREFRYCGDWYFWNEICMQGNVVSINCKLNYFRQHDNKVSPKAEKEGLYFIEGGKVMERMMLKLHLSTYQQYVICGRTLKRLYKMTKNNDHLRKEIIQTNLFFTKKCRFSIIVYELDKLFNFSRLHS